MVAADRLHMFEIYPVALVAADEMAGPADQRFGRFLRQENALLRNHFCLAQITLQIQYILQRDHVRAAIFLRRDLHRTIAQRGQGLMQRRADPLVELRL